MIIVRLTGGMGNQMFQYAHGRALSLKHRVPLKLDTTFLKHRVKMPHFLRPNFIFRNFDLDVFKIQAEMAKPEEVSFWNRPILFGPLMLVIDAILRKLAFLPGWEKGYSFNEESLQFGPDMYLEGFWQSEKYFSNISDTIRADFMLKNPISEAAQKMQEEIKKTNSICMHLRRTHGGGSFHTKYDLSYYENGLNYILQKKKVEKIFVFSDDVKWCEENIKFELPTIFVGNDSAGVKGEGHLYLMSLCQHFIIPNSTFSWWAAWLSTNPEKIVVAPKALFTNEKIKNEDLIPASWTRI